MRNNQLDLTVVRFGECEGCGGPCVYHVYSDSNNFPFALGNAFAAITMRLHGLAGESIDPNGCRCDVATTHDGDEEKRRFARFCYDLERRRHPELEGREGSGTSYVVASLQRFPRVVCDYGKDEQRIAVSAFSEDVFAALSAVYVELSGKVRGHDARAVPVNLLVRTNVDDRDPLAGDLERMRSRKEKTEGSR